MACQTRKRAKSSTRSGRLRAPALVWLGPLAALGALASTSAVSGQSGTAESEPGIPVTDALTREKCGACHTPDAKGNLSRISWLRTTPEGWDQAIKRMVRLNGAQIGPDDARHIIHYLADSHGLAPEEAEKVAYFAEKRVIDETNIPGESVRTACAACHAFAQPLSWRRSAQEWKLLQDFHVALYSQADAQYRRPAVDEPGDAAGAFRPVVTRPGAIPLTSGEVALGWLRKAAPLQTAEWTQWSARVQAPHLAGKWLISAHLPGKGLYVGTMQVAQAGDAAAYATAITLKPAAGGSVIAENGSGVVYAGYAWRGRSGAAPGALAPDAPDQPLRQVMQFSADRRSASGRWFWGEYQEFGYDVTLRRADGAPTIGAVSPGGIRAGARGQSVTIFGDAFPAGLGPRDIDLGAGLHVVRVIAAAPGEITVAVDADAGAVPGLRDVAVGSAVLPAALPVWRSVAYIRVSPETAVARLGGAAHRPGYGQFEAVGYDAGPDGKPWTADDVPIGPVDADFRMEEFRTTWYDDDIDYVGRLSPAGFFTPGLDGPNPKRPGNRNNYGNVWVVATARTARDAQGAPLVGKAYLVVTVPSFKRIDQPEVAQ